YVNIISCFDNNNANIMCSPFELSADGVELQFATNYLGKSNDRHFLQAKLLLDNLKTTTEEVGREGRVINVSSVAHKFTQSSDWTSFDNLNDPKRLPGLLLWAWRFGTKLMMHIVDLSYQMSFKQTSYLLAYR
ncbi:hypothetical protein GIB67_043071, partial [Kingdonia uniflora]